MSALPRPLPRQRLHGEGVRAVESQSMVATMPLVDTLEEQALLEEMIDATKGPPLAEGVNYLIATPLCRYPPLPWGSRFGTRGERGIFYGSENVETALAETAYYKLRFVDDSEGLNALSLVMDVFAFGYDAEGTDTLGDPFEPVREALERADDYTMSRALGAAAREENLAIIRYRSMRCPRRYANLAILQLEALNPEPLWIRGYQLDLRNERVLCVERNRIGGQALSFTAEEFRSSGAWDHPDAPPVG